MLLIGFAALGALVIGLSVALVVITMRRGRPPRWFWAIFFPVLAAHLAYVVFVLVREIGA